MLVDGVLPVITLPMSASLYFFNFIYSYIYYGYFQNGNNHVLLFIRFFL